MNARYYVPSLGRFASADTLVPDPTNPQQFNRYAYVLNNSLRFTDPTGHFSEEAINQYLLDYECGGSPICADDMMWEWSQNSEWWNMLLTAETGDILFGAFGSTGYVADGNFSFQFLGEGDSKLTGIRSTNIYGNTGDNQIAILGNIGLAKIQRGSFTIDNPYLLTGKQIIRLNWGGIVRWATGSMPSVEYVRESVADNYYFSPEVANRERIAISIGTGIAGGVATSGACAFAVGTAGSAAAGCGIVGGAVSSTILNESTYGMWTARGRLGNDLYVNAAGHQFVYRHSTSWHMIYFTGMR